MKASVKPKPSFQVATLLAGVVLLMIVFVSVGYFFTIVDGTPPKDLVIAELEQRQAQWQAAEPASYAYTVDRECYCDALYREPFTVTVEPGLISFRYSRKFEKPNLDQALSPPEPVTIDDLFQLLYNAAEHADSLSVSYDSNFGYPETIRIDWREAQADEEQYFTVRDFRAMP